MVMAMSPLPSAPLASTATALIYEHIQRPRCRSSHHWFRIRVPFTPFPPTPFPLSGPCPTRPPARPAPRGSMGPPTVPTPTLAPLPPLLLGFPISQGWKEVWGVRWSPGGASRVERGGAVRGAVTRGVRWAAQARSGQFAPGWHHLCPLLMHTYTLQ